MEACVEKPRAGEAGRSLAASIISPVFGEIIADFTGLSSKGEEVIFSATRRLEQRFQRQNGEIR
jgi:hypothetical protein